LAAADFLLALDLLVDLAGVLAADLLAEVFFAGVLDAVFFEVALAAVLVVELFLAGVLDAADLVELDLAADLAGVLLAEAFLALDLAGALVADAFLVGATVAFFPALDVAFLAPRVAPPRPRS
jgi:hypothetical protein